MIRKINILILGIILFGILSFSLAWKIMEAPISGKVISGEVTSEELQGLELGIFVPEKYQRVQAGENLQFQVSITNIQEAGRHDIQLDYYIKKNEILIMHRRELKAVETQASFFSSIPVPDDTLPGIYNIEVSINEEESAIATFYVKSSDIGQIKIYLIILIMAILVIGGIISWQLYRLSKK